MQPEDELFPRDGHLELFDALASDDKRMHADPGLHPQVPGEEIDFSFEFLGQHLPLPDWGPSMKIVDGEPTVVGTPPPLRGGRTWVFEEPAPPESRDAMGLDEEVAAGHLCRAS